MFLSVCKLLLCVCVPNVCSVRSQHSWIIYFCDLNSFERIMHLNLNEYVAGSKNGINATEEREHVTNLV